MTVLFLGRFMTDHFYEILFMIFFVALRIGIVISNDLPKVF
jgi:hypothetical protein